MRTKLSLVVAALLAGLLLAGCGGAGGGSDSGSEPGVAPTGGSSVPGGSQGYVPPSGNVSLPPQGSGKSGEITITGTPEEGVENGCIVMQSGGTLYLLLGGERQSLMVGQRVIVRGVPSPGLMTTCQQGTPFQVTDIKPA